MYCKERVVLDSSVCRRLVSCLKNESWTVGEDEGEDVVAVAFLLRDDEFGAAGCFGCDALEEDGLAPPEEVALLLAGGLPEGLIDKGVVNFVEDDKVRVWVLPAGTEDIDVIEASVVLSAGMGDNVLGVGVGVVGMGVMASAVGVSSNGFKAEVRERIESTNPFDLSVVTCGQAGPSPASSLVASSVDVLAAGVSPDGQVVFVWK